MKNRSEKLSLIQSHSRKTGRLLILTGARQTGKTTLAKVTFPDKTYISLEDPTVRPSFSNLSAAQWIERYPNAIIDEVQKAPKVIEAIKAAYDENEKVRYLLLGSSQILLLKKVKESLAGRVTIKELGPLTLPEMATKSWEEPISKSRFIYWLTNNKKDDRIFIDIPSQHQSFAKNDFLFKHYLQYGGMPAVWDEELTEEEKLNWISNYQKTYLERDIGDLVRLTDLEPFILAQKAIALRSGQLTNFSDLARNASISPNTAKRFLRYLELSYQVIILAPYFQNPEKRLTKSPKIIFLDPGVHRGILNKRGEVTGQEFESAVVAEIWKQCKIENIPANYYHLRTFEDREIDLLIELEEGFVAIEIKMTEKIGRADLRPFNNLKNLLHKPLIKCFLLSNDREVKKINEETLTLPVAWALGAMNY